MVTRYKEFYSTVLPNAEGEFVKYEDYERLKEEAMDHIASIQKQYDCLARAYAELEKKVATK